MSLIQTVSILLLLPLVAAATSFKLDLTHIDAEGNFTKLELLHRSAQRSRHRILKPTKIPAPVNPSENEYIVDLMIGTPARRFSAILDTGSDLIWTQCTPCTECFPQSTALFDPSQSSTYSKLLCNNSLCEALAQTTCRPECLYVHRYWDESSTSGVLASDIFTFGSETARIGFGCGRSNQGDFSNSSGIVGMGNGPLSMISQLGVSEFSYCFTSFPDLNKSSLFLGPKSDIQSQEKSTPLLKNPFHPTYYYLSLRGITVGRTKLRIPRGTFELKKDGSGGVIIDSGTTVTFLEEAVYKLVKREFIHQLNLQVRNASMLDDRLYLYLCFLLPAGLAAPEVPKLVFHFEGADWELTRENYFIQESGLMCLTILQGDDVTIFGNMQQQNTHIRYDLKKRKLFFAPARCGRM